ncbi:hypothetical protein AGABI1DRAFT_110805 [Agaricus bisporus var. burnettii JB137-S8]|uniref:Homeobox domain-containing protein n=2 Tax=Agaricus bisporus var. burnettii TaxID=192524 RepID=K5X8K0_AGABU|nr:uncharacterized protein AGABI1DRAFT_110805 [Agaricus bisporus var. burnettii JB137-S8]EKM84246.1 hypothetical protein AGABI1DRAFT_110805 [Agaricus bisporus var. burnettii JB137-S8]KAF7784981.1 transcriptional regulator family: Homeodomain [Agaricus bisporus var. burnettii]
MDLHYSHTSFVPPLSRTGSEETVCINNVNPTASRRTRKRFTNVQLMMLENLFHQNSHPSREDRESVAKAGGMEIKSVTIWFQNKRQTERKSAAGNHGSFNSPPLTHQPTTRRTSSPTLTNRTSTSQTSSRPSLDRVASRSELRAPAPRTPSRRLDPNATPWDNMPSSPIVDPNSPPAREFVEFGKKRRTLEWACAAARLAEKDGVRQAGAGPVPTSPSSSRPRTRDRQRPRADLESTDEEEDEIITPPGTWCGDARWAPDSRNDGVIVAHPPPKNHESIKKQDDDEEIMKAALALCGLQNRRVA